MINKSRIVVSLNMIHPTGCLTLRLNGWISWICQERGSIFTSTNHVVDICLGCHRKFHMSSTFITETHDKFQDPAGYLKRTSKRTRMQFHDAETNPESYWKNGVASPIAWMSYADQIGPLTFLLNHFSHSCPWWNLLHNHYCLIWVEHLSTSSQIFQLIVGMVFLKATSNSLPCFLGALGAPNRITHTHAPRSFLCPQCEGIPPKSNPAAHNTTQHNLQQKASAFKKKDLEEKWRSITFII